MAWVSYWLPEPDNEPAPFALAKSTLCQCNTRHASLTDHALQALQRQLKEWHPCRCLNLDDDGNAWVGSEAGNVKKIELVNLKQPAGGLSKWLEVRVVLKWSREAANSASGQSSTPTDSLSSRAQSIAASALGMLHLGSCGSWTAMVCIPCMRDGRIGSVSM